jgi:hypothetical protein
MRNFDQLTQDEQMRAVKKMRIEILEMTLSGSTPEFWKPFEYEVEGAFADAESNETPWFAGEYLLERMEANRDMKLAMLHEAGRTAKRAFYPNDDEVIIRPS